MSKTNRKECDHRVIFDSQKLQFQYPGLDFGVIQISEARIKSTLRTFPLRRTLTTPTLVTRN